MRKLYASGIFVLLAFLTSNSLTNAAPTATLITFGSNFQSVMTYLQTLKAADPSISISATRMPTEQITAVFHPRSSHAYQAVYETDAQHRLINVTVIEDSPLPLNFRGGTAGAHILHAQFMTALNVAVADDLMNAKPVAHRVDGGALETLLQGTHTGYLFSAAHSMTAAHHVVYNYCITASSYANAKKQYRS